MTVQRALPLAVVPQGPDGFVHRPDFVDESEERALVDELRRLEFNEVRMRGQVARRRTIHLGWLYGYEGRAIEPGPPIPPFLAPLRERAGELATIPAADVAEVLITEYGPGAGIGWHRDAPMFGTVIGISLVSACRFRFRRAGRTSTGATTGSPATTTPPRGGTRQGPVAGETADVAQSWETCDVTLEPRSAYVLRGSARWAWQHSIPPMKTLRYSVTFRTLRPQPS